MMKRPRELWVDVRASFWALPAVIVVAAVMLALVLIEVSQALDDDTLRDWPRLFGSGADGSRAMLSTIAGSMITVAGVVFSITIVALSLASSQYTSRVLRSFIRDRLNQMVLGIFVGIFAYCLIVLRTIRGGDEGAFVPGVAVLFAVVLAFVGIGVLIFFIHHIGTSIQASHIIAAVAGETLSAVDQLFPEPLGGSLEDGPEQSPAPHRAAGSTVPSLRTGYIQDVSLDALQEFARARGAILRMHHGVGEFVIEGAPLASLSAAGGLDDEAVRKVNAAYSVGRQRTVEQDAAYGIRQLVDVSLKGLSPGVNDVTTATLCVDHLTAILARLGDRRLGAAERGGDAGEEWVVPKRPAYGDFVAAAFDQIRQNAAGSIAMLRHLLGSLSTLSDVTSAPSRRLVLLRQVEAVTEVIERSVESGPERAALAAEARQVSAALVGPANGARG